MLTHLLKKPLTRENLHVSLSDTRKERWQEIISRLDITQNSKTAFKTIKKLNSDKKPDQRIVAMTELNSRTIAG